jgi:hypothetical protein
VLNDVWSERSDHRPEPLSSEPLRIRMTPNPDAAVVSLASRTSARRVKEIARAS